MMKRKAQSSIEYSIIITLVAAVLISMSIYSKRAIQGRVKFVSDDLSSGQSYQPRATTANSVITKTINEDQSSWNFRTDIQDRQNKTVYSNSNIGIDQELSKHEDVAAY